MSENRVMLQVTLDGVEATLVIFISWKSGMENPRASHADKCGV